MEQVWKFQRREKYVSNPGSSEPYPSHCIDEGGVVKKEEEEDDDDDDDDDDEEDFPWP